MHGRGKSDSPIVPGKSQNNIEEPRADAMEGRGLAKENPREQNASRTQSRSGSGAPSALERIREAAQKDEKQRFTSLFHHVVDAERLRAAFQALKQDAAAGVDGETWRHYAQDLEANLQDLTERLKRGAYRAKPARRAYIPKADGRQRPLGVPALEDKLVQRAVVEVLNAIYESDFVGFSYGFRPGRSPHDALDALTVAIQTKNVNWVLDADLRSFFDTLQHEWLVKFIEHRIGDPRIVRLIQKWLNAGVLEDGKRIRSELGTVQGGSISPLLANVYLHYVFDLWVWQWRRKQAQGDLVAVRFADDFVVGFEHREDAERFLLELRERFAQFGLELHPEKTRLLPFGRKPDREWRSGRGSKPGTFDFLGFTHVCGQTRSGRFVVQRRTMRKRMQAKLSAIKEVLRQRMHQTIREQGEYLRSVLRGHDRYYGVPMNGAALCLFRRAVLRLWHHTLHRRSQQHVPQAWMAALAAQWFPPAVLCRPYPSLRNAS